MRPINLRLALAGAFAATLLSGSFALATETFTERASFNLDGVVIDGCDEPITMYGTINDLLHITVTPGGAFTGVTVTGPAGLYGIGQVSGDRYQASGVTIQAQHQDVVPGELTTLVAGTLVDRTRVVGTAGATTFDFRLLFHITRIDGEDAVIFERGWLICR